MRLRKSSIPNTVNAFQYVTFRKISMFVALLLPCGAAQYIGINVNI